MRNASGDLVAHLQLGSLTMALCYRIVRNDGEAFYFTTTNQDLLIDGETYRSDISFQATAVDAKAGLSVHNMELTLPLMAGSITKADVIANLFYRAELDVFWINWYDLIQHMDLYDILAGVDGLDDLGFLYDTEDALYEAKGWRLGKATMKENRVIFEVRSKSALLNAPILDTITPDCPYTFGVNDGYRSRCPADLDNYDVTGTVTGQGGEVKRIFVDTARTEATDIYQYGVIRWDTGNNTDFQMEVESFAPATDTVTLLFDMPYDIEVGDTYTLWRGCDKRFATCQALGHYLDFGGEPNVPDQDTALQYQVQ